MVISANLIIVNELILIIVGVDLLTILLEVSLLLKLLVLLLILLLYYFWLGVIGLAHGGIRDYLSAFEWRQVSRLLTLQLLLLEWTR